MNDRVLVIVHAAATWYMLGVIWLVQMVHYPLMDRVPAADFAAFEAAHRLRIFPVVAPPMLIELVTAIAIVGRLPGGVPRGWAWLGLALVLACAVSTAFVQIPLHDRLSAGFDDDTHGRLVLTNWLRTAAWSGRGLLVGAMLARVTRQPEPDKL